ncbi:MAG: Alpha/beta hydrolase fold [Streptomyces oryziradicis]|nr:Alpha/beta hydrolase fold [Actinacidiphila oryziradicis]
MPDRPASGAAAEERTIRVRRAVIPIVSLALAAGAPATPATARAADQAPAGAVVAAGRARTAGIRFGACPADSGLKAPVQCGRVTVPVDYELPDGPTIKLLVSRLRAAGRPGRRQGALVFNPGGPGGSGLWFPLVGVPGAPQPTRKIWAAAADAYDLVGFDPRGVGYSAPLSCEKPADHQRAPTADPRRPTAAVLQIRQLAAQSMAEGCARRAGELLAHMTTADMARDLDVIRAALHEKRLNYFGVSYGTYLGAVYATLFPSHVRRMVTDSVVNPDPRGIWYGANLVQDVAFESRWADWKAWAARYDRVYRLGSTPERVQASFDRAARQLGKHPAGSRAGAGQLHSAAVQAAYYDQEWVPFAHLLASYLDGNAKALIATTTSTSKAAKSAENGDAAYLAVECGDSDWPRDWRVWHRDNSRVAKRYPFETWANAWLNLPCAYWPVPAGHPVDVGVAEGSDLPPVLILQSDRDAATPYEGALELHSRLPGSRLITETGAGSHGLVSIWNPCVSASVDRYLVEGTVDDADVRCEGHPAPVPTGRAGASDANTGHLY